MTERLDGKRDSAKKRILEIRQKNPNATAAAIARELDLTKQRVGQIIKELGLPTRVVFEHTTGKYRLGTRGKEQLATDLVVDDLKKMGFIVFISADKESDCGFDMIALRKDGEMIKIRASVEVAAGKQRKFFSKRGFDVLAEVALTGSIKYSPLIRKVLIDTI